MAGFDVKQINRNDQVIMGAGILAFIFSFLPYVGVSISILGVNYDVHINAWHSYGILGLLLVFAAAAITAVRVFAAATIPPLPVGVNVLVGAVAALGTLLVIIRAFTYSGASVEWGGWLLILSGLAVTVFAAANVKASGERLTWDSSVLGSRAAQASPRSHAGAPDVAAPAGDVPASDQGPSI
jgi:hypothetical protein